MLITNPKRKKRIHEFADEDHSAMDEFYELTDSNISEKKLLKEMQRLINEDSDFYDPYLIVADIFFQNGKDKEGTAMLEEAYNRAVMRIADCKGQWQKKCHGDFWRTGT